MRQISIKGVFDILHLIQFLRLSNGFSRGQDWLGAKGQLYQRREMLRRPLKSIVYVPGYVSP